MNGGAFGENFPYSNFHDLNMDWVIKIAKDFLDQYSNIQNTITEGTEAIEANYQRIQNLLNQWYESHSNDIAEQLTDALSSLDTESQQILNNILNSIPADYSTLSNEVNRLSDLFSSISYNENITPNFTSENRYVTLTGGSNPSANWRITPWFRVPNNIIGLYYSQACSNNNTALNTIASIAFYTEETVNSFISAVGLKNQEAGLYNNYIGVPNNAKFMRLSCLVGFEDQFFVKAVYDITDLIDNDDIQIRTRLAHSNSGAGFGPDMMLIKLKKSAFTLGVSNNAEGTGAYQVPYQGTSNPYYWLLNHPDALFAHNSCFSGGYNSAEILANHYAMRYNGTNYLASPTAPEHVYNFLAINTSSQTVAIFPYSMNVSDIPAEYNYAFGIGYQLLSNGEIVYDTETDGSLPSQRMAFGWDNDYFYIFFCEGRNNVNAGLTVTQLCNRLKAWGVPNAVQLDGGGSVCCAVNMTPNTLKINEHVDPAGIRVTSLNMNYTYHGKKQGLTLNATRAILAYVADAFHPYRADLLRVLSNIAGKTVNYQYDNGNFTLNVIE